MKCPAVREKSSSQCVLESGHKGMHLADDNGWFSIRLDHLFYPNGSELERKLELITEAYKEIAQAYHLVCHLINDDRHSSLRFEDCQEMTCSHNRKILG